MEMALLFNEVVLTPIEHQDKLWIRAAELANALGYSEVSIVSRIFRKHEDEFTPEMTQVIEIPDKTDSVVSGNLVNKTRIFSLRGCHLLSMFARTPIAKAFRKWVLDVLDRIAKEENQPQQTEDQDAPIGPADQNTLQAIVRAKVAQMPEASSRGGFPQIWSRFNNHFRLGSYKQLPQSKMAEAVEYLVKLDVHEPKALPGQKALPASGDKYEAYIDRVEEFRARTVAEMRLLLGVGLELVDVREFGTGGVAGFTPIIQDWLKSVATEPTPLVVPWHSMERAIRYSPFCLMKRMEEFLPDMEK